MRFDPGDLVVTKPSSIYPEGYRLFVPGRGDETAGNVQSGTIGFVTKMGSMYADVMFSNGIHGAIYVYDLEAVER